MDMLYGRQETDHECLGCCFKGGFYSGVIHWRIELHDKICTWIDDSSSSVEDRHEWSTTGDGKISCFCLVVQSYATLCDPIGCCSQATLFFTVSWSWLRLTSIESMMPSNISYSVTLFSCPQSFPASGSFLVSWFFTSGGQSLELQLQHQSFQWIFRVDFPLGLTGLISLLS